MNKRVIRALLIFTLFNLTYLVFDIFYNVLGVIFHWGGFPSGGLL
ncbi:MAG: hypothetical protein ACRETO_05225 [Gammaproteobacteria bacterium]